MNDRVENALREDGDVRETLTRFAADLLELGFGDEHSRAACTLLAGLATSRPERPRPVGAIAGDPADDAILACAVETGVEVLATGDRKHLVPIGEHHGVRILTPQATLAELRAGE